jgi:hypothetical protein
MRSTLFLALALAACSGSDDAPKTDTPTDGDPTDTDTVEQVHSGAPETGDTGGTTTETVCLNSVVNRFPADASTDAFFLTTVEFELNTFESDASIAVAGPDGPVDGTSEVLGRRLRWTPDAPLDPSTSYTGTLSWSCAPDTTTFTTSDLGDAVDPSVIDGAAYRLDLTNGRWIQPSGLGPAIAAILAADILIGVEVRGTDALDLTFARTDGFGYPQDRCEPTTPFPPATFANNPLYEVGPADVNLEIDGALLPVYNLELRGAFSSDGTTMEGGRIAGLADLAPLSAILAGSSDPTAVCALLSDFGVACLPCPNGGPTSCVQIEVDSVLGTVEPTGLVPRTPADIAADTACN